MSSVAVIGAGAVGCYYGARLARASHDVRFLMRRDLDAVRANGLRIESPDGSFHLARPSVFATSEAIGPVDWVICSLKTTALAAAASLVRPCLADHTRVVALMNGLGVEDELAAAIGADRVFGAMAFVCINRGEPGVVHHLKYGRLTAGHLGDDPAEVELGRALFASADLDVAAAPNLRLARWEKLCWNVPFNGLSVAAGGIGTGAIVQRPELRATAERAMREVIAVANADLRARGSADALDPEEVLSRLFALTDTMGDYRTSMALDYVNGRELEVEAIHGAVCAAARATGVPAPTVETLYALLRAADSRVRGDLATIPPE